MKTSGVLRKRIVTTVWINESSFVVCGRNKMRLKQGDNAEFCLGYLGVELCGKLN